MRTEIFSFIFDYEKDWASLSLSDRIKVSKTSNCLSLLGIDFDNKILEKVLCECPNIETLDATYHLVHSPITNIAMFASCPLGNDSLKIIQRLKHLKQLSLMNWHRLTDEGLQQLQKCQQLHSLSVSGGLTTGDESQVTGSFIDACTSIKHMRDGGFGVTPHLNWKHLKSTLENRGGTIWKLC